MAYTSQWEKVKQAYTASRSLAWRNIPNTLVPGGGVRKGQVWGALTELYL